MGKGSNRRKSQVSRDVYSDTWDSIFKKKDATPEDQGAKDHTPSDETSADTPVPEDPSVDEPILN